MKNKNFTDPVQYYAGFSRKFQGLGILISFDNPTFSNKERNAQIQILILWIRIWVIYRKP